MRCTALTAAFYKMNETPLGLIHQAADVMRKVPLGEPAYMPGVGSIRSGSGGRNVVTTRLSLDPRMPAVASFSKVPTLGYRPQHVQ